VASPIESVGRGGSAVMVAVADPPPTITDPALEDAKTSENVSFWNSAREFELIVTITFFSVSPAVNVTEPILSVKSDGD
jgi:hypothetical protein